MKKSSDNSTQTTPPSLAISYRHAAGVVNEQETVNSRESPNVVKDWLGFAEPECRHHVILRIEECHGLRDRSPKHAASIITHLSRIYYNKQCYLFQMRAQELHLTS